MNLKVKVGNGGALVTLQDKNYLASGGEAAIYVNGNMAYKLYHDPVHKLLPIQKIRELSAISNPNVIVPQELIYDAKDGSPLGYTTNFVDNSEPLVKLFTRTFKTDNNISYQMINDLVKQMQLIVADVHKAKCLIVDLNELNVLANVQPTTINAKFIDTDSYSTPSFKATAIMDSVRDRRVTTYDANKAMHYHPDEMSDWFSFAILAFNLYTNIHPYRGTHPNYKPRDKAKQMDDGISIFHQGVKVPPSVNDFKVIPARHLDWFKEIFFKNGRSVPPIADSNVPMLVPSQLVTINGTDKINVIQINSYDSNIMAVLSSMGLYYVATKTRIYSDKKEVGTHSAKRILLCSALDGSIVTAQQDNSNKINFIELGKVDPIGTASSMSMFMRNNAFYTMTSGKLIENSFVSFGGKLMHRTNDIENVSATSSKMYDGCVIQNLLGKMYLTLPYKLGSCFSRHVPQLDGYRIISAKADKNIVIVIAEKAGKYDHFILIFDKTYTNMDIRKNEDVGYDPINFAVLDNGLCAFLASPTELELFSNASKCEVMQNPPFDSTMKLLATQDGFFFINGNSLHQIKKK